MSQFARVYGPVSDILAGVPPPRRTVIPPLKPLPPIEPPERECLGCGRYLARLRFPPRLGGRSRLCADCLAAQ